jgi:hypothetical protein
VDEGETGPSILYSKVEKAIKEMKDKKATGDDDVPEDGLKLMSQLISNMYETGD